MKNTKVMAGVIVILLIAVIAEGVVILKYIVNDGNQQGRADVKQTANIEASEITKEKEEAKTAESEKTENKEDAESKELILPETELQVKELLSTGVGIMGTAGGSLKSAMAAVNLLKIADLLNAKDADAASVQGIVTSWYDELDEEFKEEYKESKDGLISLADSILAKDESVEGLLEDSGAKEDADALVIKDGMLDNWNSFKEILSSAELG